MAASDPEEPGTFRGCPSWKGATGWGCTDGMQRLQKHGRLIQNSPQDVFIGKEAGGRGYPICWKKETIKASG